MQTAMTQRAFVAAQPVRAAPKNTRAARSAVVVRASAEESRRAVLGGLLAGAVALTASAANAAGLPIDIVDDRVAQKNGLQITYEARDTDLPQGVRDGLTQARADVDGVKKRLLESERRIDQELTALVNKQYWSDARTELRRQVGTLRFDINVLADGLEKPAKKEALAAKKAFFTEVDKLDFAIRKKKDADAAKYLASAQAALDATKAKLGL